VLRKAKRGQRAYLKQTQAAGALAARQPDVGWHETLAANGAGWAPPGAPQAPSTPVAATAATETPAVQTEFLRVLEVVTRMCDHVIEYIEADRAERQLLVESLASMVQTLAEISAANTVTIPTPTPVPTPVPTPIPAPPAPPRERVLGGSMPAGPEPIPWRDTDPLIDLREPEPFGNGHEPEIFIDLREPEPFGNGHEPEIFIDLTRPDLDDEMTTPGPSQRTAVEVRCRFGEGERWVGGFEIVDVLSTDDAWKYRLRRQRDGAILPQLFDAASIRHIETFEELVAPDDKRWSRL